MGEYDLVLMIEAPNDEIALTLLLALGNLDRARTTTLKAFPIDQVAKLIEKLL